MFEKALSLVDSLLARDAKHRNGWRMSDQNLDKIILHAIDEIMELRRAILSEDFEAECDKRKAILDEFGDTMSIMLHLMRHLKLDPVDLENAMIHKMYERFPTKHEVEGQGFVMNAQPILFTAQEKRRMTLQLLIELVKGNQIEFIHGRNRMVVDGARLLTQDWNDSQVPSERILVNLKFDNG